MKNTLYPDNRIKLAEAVRKTLKKALGEKSFLQDNTEVDNGDLVLKYSGKTYTAIVRIFENVN